MVQDFFHQEVLSRKKDSKVIDMKKTMSLLAKGYGCVTQPSGSPQNFLDMVGGRKLVNGLADLS